jgi:hypothetical protein
MTATTDRSVIIDAYTAHEDRLIPAHLIPTPEQYRTGEYAANEATLVEYVVEHGLVGYVERRKAERGVPDACPLWCEAGHAAVELLVPGTDDGRQHAGPAFIVGPKGHGVIVQVTQEVEADKREPVAVDVVPVRGSAGLTPAQARGLAAVLLRLADEAEALT